LYDRLGDYDRAIDSFRRAAALDPKYPSVHRDLVLLLVKKKDWPGVINAATRAAEVEGPSVSLEVTLGHVTVAVSIPAAAIAAYPRAMAVDPDNANAHYNLAPPLWTKRDAGGAATHYRRAIECGVTNPRAHALLGAALEAGGDRVGAVAA